MVGGNTREDRSQPSVFESHERTVGVLCTPASQIGCLCPAVCRSLHCRPRHLRRLEACLISRIVTAWNHCRAPTCTTRHPRKSGCPCRWISTSGTSRSEFNCERFQSTCIDTSLATDARACRWPYSGSSYSPDSTAIYAVRSNDAEDMKNH